MRKIEDYIPQRNNMLLVDGLLEIGQSNILATVSNVSKSSFALPCGRVPTWVGIEYMGQAVAAYAGNTQIQKNLPVSLGFLSGIRQYKASRHFFFAGESLVISCIKIFGEDEGVGAFDCKILSKGQNNITEIKDMDVIAQARLKAVMLGNDIRLFDIIKRGI